MFTCQTLRCPRHPQRPRCRAAAARASRRAPSPPAPSTSTEKSSLKRVLAWMQIFSNLIQNLVNANVLLFSLDHPNTLLSHLVDDPEDVDDVVFADPLQDPVQGNEGATSANSSTEIWNICQE